MCELVSGFTASWQRWKIACVSEDAVYFLKECKAFYIVKGKNEKTMDTRLEKLRQMTEID